MLKRSPHRSVLMSTPESEAVDERLSIFEDEADINDWICLLYTSPSPRDRQKSRMPSSA